MAEVFPAWRQRHCARGGCTHSTAVKLARNMEARGWLTESTGYERNRVYRYQPYLDLFHREVIEARHAGGAGP